jgi:DNA-binding MurR/RpiR family transcriptional regulator
MKSGADLPQQVLHCKYSVSKKSIQSVQRLLNALDRMQQSLYFRCASFAVTTRPKACETRMHLLGEDGEQECSAEATGQMKSMKKTRTSVAPGRTGNKAVSGGQTALEARFARSQGRLSTSRKKLVRMILENPEDTFFLSSRELAKRYKVDAATIVRTIQVLGYGKFAEFAADLRAHFITRITPYTLLKAASREKRTLSDRIRNSLALDLRNLQSLQSTLDPERIIALAKLVKRARRILVIGIDLAASLSWHLSYGLMSLGFAAEGPVGGTGNIQKRVRSLTSKDLLIAISYKQGLRETVEAALRAKKQGVPTFGITDSIDTPIARICDSFSITPVTSVSFANSYVAPMALLGTILVACAHTRTARTLALLRRSEEEDRADHRWYWAPSNRKDLR